MKQRYICCAYISTNSKIYDILQCPISHFCCSRFHPTSRSELCSTSLFKLELCSTPISKLRSAFTSRVTTDVK